LSDIVFPNKVVKLNPQLDNLITKNATTLLGRWRRGSTQIQPEGRWRMARGFPALIAADNEASRISIIAEAFQKSLSGGFRRQVGGEGFQPTAAHSLSRSGQLLDPINVLQLCNWWFHYKDLGADVKG
jgi:hypothetical protein